MKAKILWKNSIGCGLGKDGDASFVAEIQIKIEDKPGRLREVTLDEGDTIELVEELPE